MPQSTSLARSPLVLLHGLGMSARVWDDVRPMLELQHEVLALTTLGHRGGVSPGRRRVTVRYLVEDAERALDARGLDRPHIAGNSLGGWMAIELARRGRARTVCALSPAGSWTAGTAEQTAGVRRIRRAFRLARLSPVPASVLMRSGAARRLTLRDVARHGDRLLPTQAAEITRDLLACTVLGDLLETDEEIAPLDPLPCPVTLAWSGEDAILPLAVNGAVARARLPQARFEVVPGVGHVPMIDDPAGVARTVLRAAGASRARHAA
jgi:pimeloyl-ACP methyl ester carboxylesterase